MQTPPKNSASAPNNWSFYDQQYAGGAARQHAQTSPPPLRPRTASGGPGSSRSRRPPWVTWGAVLAFIILLAALGSSSIFAGGNGGAPGQSTPLPSRTGVGTPIARSTPTTQPTATGTPGVTPTATAQPTPSPTPTGGSSLPLPTAWTASGRGSAEAIEAKDVAETFVSHYETLDWRSKNTFDQATFALTQAALTRFWQQDERANPAFIQNFINTKSVWVASIESAKTQVIKAKQWGQSFFAWLSVTYQQYHQQRDGSSYTDEHTIVVLMIAVPFGVNSVVGGIGWEVSAWQDGSQTFPIPDQP